MVRWRRTNSLWAASRPRTVEMMRERNYSEHIFINTTKNNNTSTITYNTQDN